MDFFNPFYLQNGTPRQRRASEVLRQTGILSILAAYTPVLAGTVPLDIDTEDSDLDIVCWYRTASDFENIVMENFAGRDNFSINRSQVNGQDTVIASFRSEEFTIEIFGQDRPVQEQEAVRHMLIEHSIIQEQGDAFKLKIRELKKKGLKTEPAFALLLGLDGDPYKALLQYGNCGGK